MKMLAMLKIEEALEAMRKWWEGERECEWL